MHRDLKAEVAKRPSSNLSAQQKSFDRWRQTYNHERPHEALDMLRPAEIYRSSKRRLGEKDKMRYPEGYEIKRVGQSGHFSFHGANFYMSEIFSGCRVGLVENGQGITELHYANLHLGNLDFKERNPWRPDTRVIGPNQVPHTPRG